MGDINMRELRKTTRVDANKERRGWVLQILNMYAAGQPDVTDEMLQDALHAVNISVELPTLHGDLHYLRDKGYLETEERHTNVFHLHIARITAKGIDLVENTIEDSGVTFRGAE